jgi:hypothetical protein
VAAYSIYSQLPSIAGGHSLIHNRRKRHAAVTGNPLNMAGNNMVIKKEIKLLIHISQNERSYYCQ